MSATFEKWAKAVILVLLGTTLVFAFLNLDRLGVYRAYFRDTSPSVQMRYAELSTAMDETALRRHFAGVQLQCYRDDSTSLGDRLCHVAVDEVDGLPAMMLVLFLRNGRLAHTVVQVPAWYHGRWHAQLMRLHGQPRRAGKVSLLEGPVIRWNLPGGSLEFNQRRSFDPLKWSAVFFSPRGAPAS